MDKRKINPCTLAVIKTLSYSGVFGFPLSFYQITSNLISPNKFSDKKIKKELEKLIEKRIVKKTKKRFALIGIKNHDRDKRLKITNDIIKKNKPYIEIISKVPWLKMIAITGSVANQNAEKGSDVDLLFVTEKKRLWISRALVFLILKILGKLPPDKSKREICPNIFVDEGRMGWAKKKRNLYVAQNILSTVPFLWRDDTYFKFMQSNKWVEKYYGNFKINYPKEHSKNKTRNSLVMNFLENSARKFQINRMKKSITTETVNSTLIHFNKNDSTKIILNKYRKIYKEAVKKLNG
jgi:predicted nucleotidyltransferase